jgi:membrane fusion protein, multidrug efflux system
MATTVEGADVTGSWRRRILLWVVPAVAVAIAILLYGSAGRYVATDNAYVQRDRVDVAPQVSGDVREVYVAENARVAAGQPVLTLDDSLLKIAVAAAESRLIAARAEVEGAQASYREKSGEVELARQTAEYALRDERRQDELGLRKLAAQTAVDSAHRTADIAVGAIGVLELQRKQLAARLGGDATLAVDAYAPVQTALAERARARLELSYTRIAAPQAGVASHLPKTGARVELGRPAFAIVSDRSVWVEANFKETDLEWVRPGESAEVVIDTYPQRRWKGHVESISQATGAEFSLLPAQNASGNWVKVVQRIPVRVALELTGDDPPLRDGMSATVNIDTGPHSHFDRWFGHGR